MAPEASMDKQWHHSDNQDLSGATEKEMETHLQLSTAKIQKMTAVTKTTSLLHFASVILH